MLIIWLYNARPSINNKTVCERFPAREGTMAISRKDLIEKGMNVSASLMMAEDKIWARYSSDKSNVGENIARVMRTLVKAMPLSRRLRVFSLGSSDEPQFRLLLACFTGGLYLLDIDPVALDHVKERVRRQRLRNVHTIRADFDKIFLDREATDRFLQERLHGKKMQLITFQHSMYYCVKARWMDLMRSVYTCILAPRGAIYSVLMAAKSADPFTTTWLYNHYAGKFCGYVNDQDLMHFALELKRNRTFHEAQIFTKTSRVQFWTDDFEKFMAVIWMIMLYPQVHKYTVEQRREITEHCYRTYFEPKKPLVQIQNHLAVYRGIEFKGMV